MHSHADGQDPARKPGVWLWRSDLVEALRNVGGLCVSESELTREDFRRVSQDSPVGREERDVCRAQRGEREAREVREAELKRAIRQFCRTGQYDGRKVKAHYAGGAWDAVGKYGHQRMAGCQAADRRGSDGN